MKIYEITFDNYYGREVKHVNSKDERIQLIVDGHGHILVTEEEINYMYNTYNVYNAKCVGELYSNEREVK